MDANAMWNVLITMAAAGAGWMLGRLGSRRTIEDRVDKRIAELEKRLFTDGAGKTALPVAAAAAGPAAAAGGPVPRQERIPPSAPAPQPAPVPQHAVEEEPSPEVLAVISAAICAFLGKPARIRRVRRVAAGVNPWAQVGRVSVMASHALVKH